MIYVLFAVVAAMSASAGQFSAEVGLEKSRKEALAPLSDRAKPSVVVWTEGGVLSPAGVFEADGKCAVLKR